MTIQQILLDIMKKEKVTNVELAKQLGVSRQAVQQMLKGDDMKISTVVVILSILGYEFKIVKDGEEE